jgi:hypothetical protein
MAPLDYLSKIIDYTYIYVEKIDWTAHREVELFINSRQKELNKLLKNKYNISINDHVITRAWKKFYEIIHDTKIFDNYKDATEFNTFFLCEAPGNFVNSMNYYIETKTNIKNHKWTAQSLNTSAADFFDTYGFIEKTKDKWDLGPSGTGDMTNFDNFMYYYKKYKNVDMIASDCGISWKGYDSPSTQYNILSYFQMFYAILFPKVGGNFIIKIFMGNYNKLFISLLYIASKVYQKLIVFKPLTNFWSYETYIIGIRKMHISEHNTKILLESAELSSKNIIKYPIDTIPESFTNSYYNIILNMITDIAATKKFFIFLAENQQYFDAKHKKIIADRITQQNNNWIKAYLQS